MTVTMTALVLLSLAMALSVAVAGYSLLRVLRSRAGRWNALGITCLLICLLVLVRWAPSPTSGQSAAHSVLRHAWSDARLRFHGHHDERLPALGGPTKPPGLPTVEKQLAMPVTPQPDAVQTNSTGDDAGEVSPPSPTPSPATDGEADAAAGQGLLDGALSPELRAQVQIDYAARPAWVEQADRDVGELHQIAVTSGPYLRQRLARRELDAQLKHAVDEYINDLVGNPQAADWLHYDAASLRERFVAADKIYDEQVISPSFGHMYQSHALLELGPEFHQEVAEAWHAIIARTRLAKVAAAAAAVLGALLLVCGYFRADTATKGFYTRRLQFATLVAILGLVASGFLAAHKIPWLWP